MKTFKLKPGQLLMTIGLLLIAAALCWAGYNIVTDYQGGQSSSEALSRLQSMIPRARQRSVSLYSDSFTQEDQVPDYMTIQDLPMPVRKVDGVNYIGIISCPTVGVELPVASRWSYEKLKQSPCRYTGSIYQENLVIAGHNFRSHFGPLSNLRAGDEVSFTDAEGNLFLYVVDSVDALNPEDVEEMTHSGYPLTLFTCTLGGQYRITVRCVAADATGQQGAG